MNFANETKFRQHVVAAIRKGGGFAQQIESPTLRGIPDVFYKNAPCSPGWLELKVVRPKDKCVVQVSGAQWRWASNASKAGIKVAVLVWEQKHSCVGIQQVNMNTWYSDLRYLLLYEPKPFTEKEFDNWLATL